MLDNSRSRLILGVLFALVATAAPSLAGPDDETPGKLDPALRRLAQGSRVIQAEGPTDRLPPASSRAALGFPGFLKRIDRSGNRVDVTIGWYPRGSSTLETLLAATESSLLGRVGPVVSLRVPTVALEELAGSPAVRWIRSTPRYRPLTEISTGVNHVDSDGVAAQFGLDGSGVIVAVIDSGIDWRNQDFRNGDGTTRVLGIWDQTISAPEFPPPPGHSFGAWFSKAVIDDALAAGDPLPTDDIFGHGTHVGGIAAGNGRQTGNGVPAGTFAGVAPRADLLVVKVFEGADADFCADCDLTAALQFVRDTAQSAGKPWVANLSLGSNLGAHDGTSPTELAIDALVGPGRPGGAVAVSAGNSGWSARHFHWEGLLQTDLNLTNDFGLPTGTPTPGHDNDFVWIDLWYAGEDRTTVAVFTPDGSRVEAAFGVDSGIVCTPSGAVQIDATNGPDPINGDNEVFVQIWDSSECAPVSDVAEGDWTLEILPDQVNSASPEFDAWMIAEYRGFRWVYFDTFSLDETLNMPATSRHAIVASGYVSKDQWPNASDPPSVTGPCCSSTEPGSRMFFSSVGPTRDGRAKPDLSAPSEFVGSTLSTDDPTPPGGSFRERDGQHHLLRGTSMAAPHVAGMAALLLQLEPGFDSAEIGEILRTTTRVDAFTGAVPNQHFGHGKLYGLGAVFEGAARTTDLVAGPGGFAGSDRDQIGAYNVYRTLLAALPENYGSCLLPGLPAPNFTDPTIPPTGQGFAYLVTGRYVDPDGGAQRESGAGLDSRGNQRLTASICP